MAKTMMPFQLTQVSGVTNGVEDKIVHSSLRAQVQPFQTYTPQQIQEQLQHLHIQQHNECDTGVVSASLQQSNAACGDEHTHSRKILSSHQESGSSVLHHLLSQSPTTPTLSSGVQANPVSQHPTQSTFTENQPLPLVISTQQEPPKSITQSDCSAMLRNIASRDLPSFPVSIQTQQTFPIKGHCSPIHDYEMLSVAEHTREEIIGRTSEREIFAISGVQQELTNGLQPASQQAYCFTHTVSNHSTQMQPHTSVNSQTQISLNDNTVRLPVPMPSTVETTNTILSRISTVLNGNRIQHYQSCGGFVVEHDGVKLFIASNPPHMNTIHMQFIAGDPIQYQALSSHLATQLQLSQ